MANGSDGTQILLANLAKFHSRNESIQGRIDRGELKGCGADHEVVAVHTSGFSLFAECEIARISREVRMEELAKEEAKRLDGLERQRSDDTARLARGQEDLLRRLSENEKLYMDAMALLRHQERLEHEEQAKTQTTMSGWMERLLGKAKLGKSEFTGIAALIVTVFLCMAGSAILYNRFTIKVVQKVEQELVASDNATADRVAARVLTVLTAADDSGTAPVANP